MTTTSSSNDDGDTKKDNMQKPAPSPEGGTATALTGEESMTLRDSTTRSRSSRWDDTASSTTSINSNKKRQGSETTDGDDEENEEDKDGPVETSGASLSKILKLAKPEICMLLVALVFMIGSESTGLITPLIIADAYDSLVDVELTEDDRLKEISKFMFIAILVHAAGIVAGFIRASILGIAGERLVARLRNQLYESILYQEIAFFDSHKSGELVSRLGSDTTLLQNAISQSIPESLLGMMKVIVSVTLMFYISPKLAGITLGMVFILMVFSIPMGQLLGRLSKEYQNALGEAQTYSTETFGAMRTVQSFAAQSREVYRFTTKIGNPDLCKYWIPAPSNDAKEKNEKDDKDGIVATNSKTTYSVGFYKAITTSGFFTFIFGFGFGAMYLTLWYGFTLVSKGEITLGQLTAFQSYIFTVGFGLGGTSTHIAKAVEGLGASGRIFYLLERIPLIPTPTLDSKNDDKATAAASKKDEGTNNTDAAARAGKEDDLEVGTVTSEVVPFRPISPLLKPKSMEGDVTFENVGFSYPTRANVPVLRDFTLSVPSNTTAALVGSSGAGKSTVVALLQRFYEVNTGSIKIDGNDIRNLDLQWLRSNIGYVQQEPQLFGLTVRENVLYGVDDDNPDCKITQDDIEQACKDANAHDFIMSWPKGYDTLVGERGVKLSGGQKQRLAIARALLTKCRILLLDEATSALDAESEHLVQEAINKAVEGRTVLIVAHRLSTIRRASQIVVLDKHKIVDIGTHEELLTRCTKYQDLIKRQQGGHRHGQGHSRHENK